MSSTPDPRRDQTFGSLGGHFAYPFAHGNSCAGGGLTSQVEGIREGATVFAFPHQDLFTVAGTDVARVADVDARVATLFPLVERPARSLPMPAALAWASRWPSRVAGSTRTSVGTWALLRKSVQVSTGERCPVLSRRRRQGLVAALQCSDTPAPRRWSRTQSEPGWVVGGYRPMTERFYVDLSYLRSPTTGVGIYATRLAQYLEERFHCDILAPPQFRNAFATAVPVPDPWHLHNAVLSRAPFARLSRGIRFGRQTFVYSPHMRPFLSAPNQVVTIHDLIHHYYPTRNAVENSFNKVVLPRLLRRLTAIFTVSQASKLALCDMYGLTSDRVKVVPNGIDLGLWHPSGRPAASDPPYLLVVSANRPYKNTVELLEQHELWADRYRLVIVNTLGRYGGVVKESIRTLGLEELVDLRNDISESELVQLYQDCTATVYPSVMEGFGRPALESMAAGRPVILSDIPVHRENFGQAAIFVSNGDPESWKRAFAEVDEHRRIEGIIHQGIQVARCLTWEESGSRLVKALLEVEPGLTELSR